MEEEDIKKLVLARLEAMPDHIEVNLGSGQVLQKADLISHVKSSDPLGQQIIDMQMAYLKELKNL